MSPKKSPGDHTWDLPLRYHLCPKCGLIIESRTDFELKSLGTGDECSQLESKSPGTGDECSQKVKGAPAASDSSSKPNRYIKQLTCPRCNHFFEVEKPIQKHTLSLLGKGTPYTFDWS